MIQNRIEYAIRALETQKEKIAATVLRGQSFDSRMELSDGGCRRI
jgi:hypothetical protein